MEEELDIILSAVDNASDTFQSVSDAAEQMGQSMQDSAESGSSGFEEVQASAEEVAAGLGDMQGSAEEAGYSMEQLIDYCQNMYSGAIEKVADETGRAKEESEEAGNSFSNLSSILEGIVGAEIFTKIADALWDAADRAGTFEDSLMRARLEAEGAGIDVNAMTDAVSELSTTTGRAGSEIRESFIKATARGITDLDSFKSMMEGAGAQATLFGTDIQSMADKFSNMAMRSTLMERSLASTGITMEELAEAMGMAGATADEVKDKWQELDTNQRAALLGQAAAMNEGQTANEEYKKSWAGLQAQIDIAKGRIERLAGEVLLPVLIPALETAARVLDWVGDQIDGLINGPFGGLISVVGAAAAAFALAVPAYVALSGAITLLEATAIPAATALWAMVSPLLPFIALGAAVAYVVFEIGKAFGWWTDVSSMLDAVWAGIQRLWSAFINHPDVQGFINGIRQAWAALRPYIQSVVSWVLSFFNVSSTGKFDAVRAIIDTVGKAWKQMTMPIRLVISVIKLLISTFKQWNNNAQSSVNRVRALFRALPGAIRSAISSLVNIITAPFRTAYTSISKTVGNIKSTIRTITSVNIGSVTSKLTQPFTSAYNSIVKTVNNIISKAKSIPNNIPIIGGMFGGADLAYGGEDLIPTNTGPMTVNQNINLSLDLKNVPAGIDQDLLHGVVVETLTDKNVISLLVNNNDFQSLDNKVKSRILAKNSRARGA